MEKKFSVSSLTTNDPTTPINRIRVETALSRFPIHRLARKGTISINYQRFSDSGEAVFCWKVSHNSELGQPGPLAYKVDTLVVNRRIDEAQRPLPELIKLGSFAEICSELQVTDSGQNNEHIRKALLQNAFAAITAKIRYRTKSGKEKWTEIGYTRYSVIFAGESLPDGNQADAVYILLNRPFRDLLDQVEVRPLNYDYLRKLPPASQRFYELLSFQIYGAVASGRPRAKMLYSEYCKYAPQTRYPDFDHVKKQMYKVHLPHRESGYIIKVDYQQIFDIEGNADWEMFYTPGPKARAEYQAFTTRLITPLTSSNTRSRGIVGKVKFEPVQSELDLSDGDNVLVAELISRGVNAKKALDLVRNAQSRQSVSAQIAYFDYLTANDVRKTITSPPGFLVSMIRDNASVPEYIQVLSATDVDSSCEDNQATRQTQCRMAFEEYQRAQAVRYISEEMPSADYKEIFNRHRLSNRRLYKSMTAAQVDQVTKTTVVGEVLQSGVVQVLSFEEFCEKRDL